MKKKITKKEMEKIHPYIPEVYTRLEQGRVSRREFLRTATLLGMSAGAAVIASACGAQPAETGTEATAEQATEPAAQATEEVVAAAASGPVRGGTLRTGFALQAIDHPARFSWSEGPNTLREVFEYLTETDKDNITHPVLLESWEANDDLTVWDLNLRQGIKWTNGDEFVAEHVKWNFEEWLNPDIGSSILGFWEGFLTPSGLEIVDDYTLRLNLDAPLITVPEILFHYPAMIIHPSFDGDITSGNNASTGAHLLEEYTPGERAKTVARWTKGDEGYWRKGADGKPLTYVEAMEFLDLGEDPTAYLTALQTGELDVLELTSPDQFLALRNDSDVIVNPVPTSQTQVLRFRVDLEPWSDNRVRMAVKKLQQRQKMLDNTFFGEGIIGYDTHVSPVHPSFAPMDDIPYDPEGARALLDEAGFDTLDFTISVATGWEWVVGIAETLVEDAKPAGVNITLDTMPLSAYWDVWTETPVGITAWGHRPLAVMVLPLAYTADSDGVPVAWNESRWVDEEFSALLKEAQGTLDVEARRAIMADIQRIQAERGSIGVAYFYNRWKAHIPGWVNLPAHPTGYNLFSEAYFDPDKAGG